MGTFSQVLCFLGIFSGMVIGLLKRVEVKTQKYRGLALAWTALLRNNSVLLMTLEATWVSSIERSKMGIETL
jgi:hypothetical protein